MKKILLALVALGMVSVANAATSTGSISLAGTLSGSCATTIGTGNLNFTLVPEVAATPATSNYVLACTAGTAISSITAGSANTWKMLDTTSGDSVTYALTAAAFSPNYSGKLIPTWSSGTAITTVSTAAITIDDSANPVTAMLTVTPGMTPGDANVGTYADTITITANY